MIRFAFLFMLIVSIVSCNQPQKNKILTQSNNKVFPKYASFFHVEEFSTYKKLTVANPWDSIHNYATYYLVSKNQKTPQSLLKEATIIRTPVSNIAVISTPHIGLVDKLGLTQHISGIGESKYIYNKTIIKEVSENRITEIGSSFNLNLEALLNLKPELLLATGYQVANSNLQQASKFGIPVIYSLDWMEQTPLARAEWLKFISYFFEKETTADSIFKTIEKRYINVKNKISTQNHKPKVIVGQEWKGVWNTPGGKSYFANLLQDAGADYYWKNDKNTGSLALSFEEVLDKQSNAKIWLNPGQFKSIQDLINANKKLTYFKSVKEKHVYGYVKQTNQDGVNAYWETSGVNPDIVLSDLVKICQPEALPNYQLFYYKKLD